MSKEETEHQAEVASEENDLARFPTWLYVITLALTFATFAFVVSAAFGNYRALESFRNRESRIRALHGIILRLDEVLTMSAQMAAATGDQRWEQRYLLYDPQLEAAIAEEKALVPAGSSIAAIAGTDAANAKLVAMEKRAFLLVRAGYLNEARAILSSPAYETQKVLYSKDLDKILKEQQARFDKTLARARQRATLALAASVALLLLSIATWIVIIRRLRAMQRKLEHRFTERTAELRAANAGLLRARDAAEKVAKINHDLGRRSSVILDSVTDGIIGLSANAQPTFLNPAAEKMLGRGLHDFKGMTFHEAVHHSHPDGTPYDVAECPGGISLRRGESITAAPDLFWRADGSSFPVEYSATPARDAEGNTAAVMTFRDVTERRAIDRMKDEFVSTVSHELRTPLTSIRGALGLLSSGMLGTIAEKGQRMLQIAVTNTDRLVRLINDILDLERIDSGKIELTRTDVDAATLMTQAVEGVQSMADEAGVSLATEQVQATLWIDSDRIMQTLTNLLSNAIKFSPRGTTVTLSGLSDDANFTFRVADEGRGVPADKLETIFERFKQVDASDSRDRGGSGLGLTICRSIVTAHLGRIWAERNAGGGSVFQFSIPLRRSVPAVEPAYADIIPAVGSRAILVVEDDVDLARVMITALRSRGIRTLHAPTGQEALALCQEHHPMLIVLDLDLPDIDGYAVVTSLRKLKTLSRTPLLIYSATEIRSVDQARLELGPTEFLTKSRGSMQDFTSQVVRMINAVSMPTEKTEHAA